MIFERSLDDIVCGINGICSEISLGDGNEKKIAVQMVRYFILWNVINGHKLVSGLVHELENRAL